MSFDKILKKEQKILKIKYFRFVKKLDKKNVNNSPFRYPCTWYENLSKSFLNLFLGKKNYQNFIYNYIKEILLIFSLMSYKLYSPTNKQNEYDNVYITWIKNNDISNGFLINDRYINRRNNVKKDVFFSVNLDKKFKKKNLKNIFVLSKSSIFKINTIINLFYLIKFVCILIVKKNFFYSINVYSFFSYIFYSNFEKIFNKKKIKRIYMSYEGQPFQNYLIEKIKYQNKNIQIIGIVNSFQPFPIHLYNQTNSPDKIICCHRSIKEHMINNLNWKKNNFEKISFTKLNNFKGQILLPFSVKSYDKIFNILYNLHKNKKVKGLNNLNLKLHPNTPENFQQKIFKLKCKKIFKSKIGKQKSKILISIGATSTIMENLLLGNTVYQIYENKDLECLSTIFWPKLKSKKIDTNVVRYRLN